MCIQSPRGTRLSHHWELGQWPFDSKSSNLSSDLQAAGNNTVRWKSLPSDAWITPRHSTLSETFSSYSSPNCCSRASSRMASQWNLKEPRVSLSMAWDNLVVKYRHSGRLVMYCFIQIVDYQLGWRHPAWQNICSLLFTLWIVSLCVRVIVCTMDIIQSVKAVWMHISAYVIQCLFRMLTVTMQGVSEWAIPMKYLETFDRKHHVKILNHPMRFLGSALLVIIDSWNQSMHLASSTWWAMSTALRKTSTCKCSASVLQQ